MRSAAAMPRPARSRRILVEQGLPDRAGEPDQEDVEAELRDVLHEEDDAEGGEIEAALRRAEQAGEGEHAGEGE